jgi:hypothetical protein
VIGPFPTPLSLIVKLRPILYSQLHAETVSTRHIQFTALATSTLRLTTSNFIFQLNICGYIPYVTSSLMREWFCRLQLLLVLVSAVILRSESLGNHDHILLSQILDSPQPRMPGLPIYIPQEKGGQVIPPGTGFSSSPPTTLRATVEVFVPASTRDYSSHILSDHIYVQKVVQKRKFQFLYKMTVNNESLQEKLASVW